MQYEPLRIAWLERIEYTAKAFVAGGWGLQLLILLPD
jgi:hypothetical protein